MTPPIRANEPNSEAWSDNSPTAALSDSSSAYTSSPRSSDGGAPWSFDSYADDSPARAQGRCMQCLGISTRCIFLDVPLVLLFVVYISLAALHEFDTRYLSARLDLIYFLDGEREFKDITYYYRLCDSRDMSTHQLSDLFLPPNFTAEAATSHMIKHGVSRYSRILSDSTIEDLREYVLARNANITETETIKVRNMENRWSYAISATEDHSVAKALREIATHPLFRPALDKIAGDNAAIVEIQALTSAYGAKAQGWHSDTINARSGNMYARSFAPVYSLFIPLQDTTAEMGATGVCPGTHMCSDGAVGVCERHGFQVSVHDNIWKRGHGIFYNQEVFHRGEAHTDPNGEDRVVFIVSFAPRPRDRVESRMVSLGGTYSMKWEMWASTIADMEDPVGRLAHPWAGLRALGLYKLPGTYWGWDYLTIQSTRISNGDTSFYRDQLDDFVAKGGFGLPDIFQAKLTNDMLWDDYLSYTLYRLEYWALAANAAVLVLYLGSLVLVDMRQRARMKEARRGLNLTARALMRLAVTHGTVLLLTTWVMYRTSQSSFAKDIVSRRLNASPFPTQVDSALALPKGPTTVPTRWDVLIGTRFDSEYLASYVSFLDAHFGNVLWKEMVTDISDLYRSYVGLSPAFRRSVIRWIMDEIHQTRPARFLLQNNNGDWVVLSAEQSEKYAERELLLKGNRALMVVRRGIKFGLSDCLYGPMRDTAMFRRHTVRSLKAFEHQILGAGAEEWASGETGAAKKRQLSKAKFKVTPTVPLKILKKENLSRGRRALPPMHGPIPDGGWLVEGDVVEARIDSEADTWGKATVTRVYAEGSVDVVFEDADNSVNLTWGSVR